MRDHAAFASSMTALALALPGREITEPMLEVYWRALTSLTDAEFQRAAGEALRRSKFFPVPAELLEWGRPHAVDPVATAARTLARAELLTEYCPNSGTWWSGERIRKEIGEAAYQAFHACGGSPGFRQIDDPYHGPGVRKAFVECYLRVVRLEPRFALPTPDVTGSPQLTRSST